MDGFSTNRELANSLNNFYLRFDQFDFKDEVDELRYKFKDKHHLILDQGAVENSFFSQKLNKSPGPDNICGKLLKYCAGQLSSIFHDIFNMSLYLQHVPKLWKQAVIIPVPKSNSPKVLNDLRPVALTSLVMKSFEKLVNMEIVRQTEQALDPMQFAYRAHRGVEDATLLNLLLKHLEGSKTHARLLFVDFSSAFNTIQPHILAKRLIQHFDLSENLVGWILDFLINRTQRVRVNGTLSDLLCTSTGSPQGCVLSPLFYILYTNMCQSMYCMQTERF